MDTSPNSLTFPKTQKLCHRKDIDLLFENGDSFFTHPFKVVIKETERTDESAVRLLISVPKKNLRSSVDRNRVKRLIREAYRLNKQLLFQLLQEKDKCLQIALVYTGKQVPDFQPIEKSLLKILDKLIQQYKS
ncbi:MAG: ribonuclease P protein component [Bacteroidales bacterium]|nr:ribonuclease P protein component [Bacteroidales bacterium]